MRTNVPWQWYVVMSITPMWHCWQSWLVPNLFTPLSHPCTSSTLESSALSTAVTASHWLLRFLILVPHFTQYHQYTSYYCLSFSPVSVPVPILVLFLFLFLFLFLVPVPVLYPVAYGYALRLHIYRPPPCIIFDMFWISTLDYCSHCLLNLWSLPTSIWLL